MSYAKANQTPARLLGRAQPRHRIEAESGLLARSSVRTLWLSLGAEPCALSRGGKARWDPWKSCTAGRIGTYARLGEAHVPVS